MGFTTRGKRWAPGRFPAAREHSGASPAAAGIPLASPTHRRGGMATGATSAREQLDPKAPARALDREAFWALYHLFAEPHWERAVREQDPELLHREAARVRAAVKTSLGTDPAGPLDAGGLRQLVREWGAAWLGGVGPLPPRWAVQLPTPSKTSGRVFPPAPAPPGA